MPETQELDREIKGLHPQMNEVSGVPEGGLLEARNCVVDRPGVLSKRRGFDRYGPQLSLSPSSIFEYQTRLVIQEGETLKYDSDGSGTSWASWAGQFKAADADYDLSPVEFGNNLYFTTDKGVYKNDSLTNDPILSGIPAALDIELTGAGSLGWFPGDTAVSYRIIWAREDEKERLMLGTPSYRQVIQNPSHQNVTLLYDGFNRTTVTDTAHGFNSGDAVNVTCNNEPLYTSTAAIIDVVDADTYTYAMSTDQELSSETGLVEISFSSVEVKFSVPDGLSVAKGDFYEIYRTEVTQKIVTGLIGLPNDEHKLIIKGDLTAADIAARVITVTDDRLPIELGFSLYSNSNMETISQQNTVPPHCKDLAQFKNYLWAANVKQPHLKQLHFDTITETSVAGEPFVEVGDSITITVGETPFTYTFAAVENIENREFLLDSTSSTQAIRRRKTMKSLMRVINRHPTDSSLYAFYNSLDADPAGKILLKARDLSVPQFHVNASNAQVGKCFQSDIPTDGTTVKSSNSEQKNAVQYSKLDQPEAFPIVNQFLVGSDNYGVIRIIPLRDSLIVLKPDGVFRVTGESASTFIVRSLDNTVKVVAPRTAVALNNSVFCLSSQGVLKIDENGTQAISWAVEKDLINAATYTGISSSAYAIAYESERKYILSIPSSSGERTASKQWVYNYLTKEWTTWDRPSTSAHVLVSTDKLYMTHTADKYIVQERKSSTTVTVNEDYMDETLAVGYDVGSPGTTTDANGKTVSTIRLTEVGSEYKYGWTYPRELRSGYLFKVQNIGTKKVNRSSKVMSVSVALSEGDYQATLILADDLGLTTALFGLSLSLPIDSYVRWSPEDASVRTLTKQFTYAAISFQEDHALAHELGFYSDVVPAEEWVNTINLTAPTGWGYGSWGTDPWGDDPIASTPVVSAVPRQHQRCRALSLIYRHRAANERFDMQSMSLTYRPYQGKLVRQPA